MKILLISGSHPRHFYIHRKILKMNFNCKAIIMKRENLIPNFKKLKSVSDKKNMKKHFYERFKKELSVYGNPSINEIFSKVEYIECDKESLNSRKINNFAKKFNADICIVFGSAIIKSKLLKILPQDTINIHLGLSPMYKGSATLFWPFYNLEPQFAGATFHKVSLNADAGEILHQCVPRLKINDGIHDIGAKVVVKAANDLIKLLKNRKKKKWIYKKQKKTGKLFLIKDFKPRHLKVIYDLYNNKIVNEYLQNKKQFEKPSLIKGL